MSDDSLAARLAAARGAQGRTIAARDEARETVIAAIRRLEEKLVDALDGEHLRGLPNLGATRDRFYAIRVRSEGANATLSIGTGEAPLVLTKEGVLAFARWTFDADERRDCIVAPAAADQDFLLEDVEAVVRTVAWAIDAHVEQLGKTTEKLERIASLAADILARIGPTARVPKAG